MPFGIISAQVEFQRRMEKALERLDGFAVIIDDLLVFGSTLEEHNKRLVAVLERARRKCIKFNKAKCSFCAKSVTFFGHIISEQGMKPDPDKLKAINTMPTPSNLKEFATLLGILNYLAKYIPNLSTQNKTLRDLSKDTEFKWSKEHKEAFTKTSNTEQSQTWHTSTIYCKSIDLTVDASSHDLEVYISSNGNVVAYASCSLSKAEQKYSQLEKELYAIVFGCKYFHHFIYGRHVKITTDHRPLETILRNPLQKASARVQSNDSSYSILMTQSSVTDQGQKLKSQTIYQGCTYLKLTRRSIEKSSCISTKLHVYFLLAIQGSRKYDFIPRKMSTWFISEKPYKADDTTPESNVPWISLHPLHTFNTSCHTWMALFLYAKGSLSQGRCNPKSTSNSTSHKQLHLGTGKDKTTRQDACLLAKDEWWYRSALITNFPACQKHSRNNQKEPLMHSQIPLVPRQQVASDIFDWNEAKYLITVDYHSRFFEVNLLKNLTSKEVISKLKANFARHGIPHLIISDNRTQYLYTEFERLHRKNGAKGTRHPVPIYPQSNGKVEKAVHTY